MHTATSVSKHFALACTTALLLIILCFQAEGAPPKAKPVPPNPQHKEAVPVVPPKALPVPETANAESGPIRSIPLPKKQIDVQYSFDENGIKSGGKMKSLIGKVMVPSMEHTMRCHGYLDQE